MSVVGRATAMAGPRATAERWLEARETTAQKQKRRLPEGKRRFV